MRDTPVCISMPMSEMAKPRKVAKTDFDSDAPPMVDTNTSAKSIKAKYSGGPKSSDNSTKLGASNISANVANVPPTKELIMAVLSAVPAAPAWPMDARQKW